MYVTVFAGGDPPFSVKLEDYQKDKVSFGRSGENDIVLHSQIVSSRHGYFRRDGRTWLITDNHSTNGLTVNEERIRERLVSDGLKIYIGSENHSERVVFLLSAAGRDNLYQHCRLDKKEILRIGRLETCDICLEHVGVSGVHAEIWKKTDGYYIKPEGKNGIRFNGRLLQMEGRKLSDMDRFMIGDTQFLYRAGEIIYYGYKDGLGLEVSHLTKKVAAGKKRKTIVEDVSLQILPGEFVAIVGGSGAGKTSLLKCISGCTPITEGAVLIQGEDIRQGYESMKRLIGYVPQQDIVYDNLTLERMLTYSARLRMPQDTSRQDIRERIRRVLQMVELTGHEGDLIKKLSGGQKKRASIAVEMLSDPGIFFLDEPTSGLDPGTEQNLMNTLKQMTDHGKTIILVTHTPLNLHLCDRIIFMGPGGRLCFSGSPKEALEFFGVGNFVSIYNRIQQEPLKWCDEFSRSQTAFPSPVGNTKERREKGRVPALRQLWILSARYLEMIGRDGKKLAMQAVMVPGLAMLLYLAFSGSLHPFVVSSDTQTFSLALACCCFWLGLFQSIQEICKERVIVEREKMADLKSGAYFFSKLLVLGGILLIQCILLLGCVWLLIGHPEKGVMFQRMPFLEYLLTTYLTAVSAAALGLVVSALVNSTDQAVAVAPLLLIPQILFSEIICTLSGAAEKLSWLVSCKWACLAYGASARINDLAGEFGESETALWQSGSQVDGFIHARYTFETPVYALHNPTPMSWLALLLLTALFAAVTLAALKGRREL